MPGSLVGVNTLVPNRLVKTSIENGLVNMPGERFWMLHENFTSNDQGLVENCQFFLLSKGTMKRGDIGHLLLDSNQFLVQLSFCFFLTRKRTLWCLCPRKSEKYPDHEDTGKVQGISLKRNPAIQMAMAQMQAWFSGQYAALRKDYSITQVNSNTLRFVPRESTVVAGVIAQVEVCFLEDESYISSITISEKSGDQTALVFENTSLNKPVPSQAFDAKPSERK